MTSTNALLPYSTEMSRSPEDERTASFQYRNSFLSSDLPTSELDYEDYPTPKPLNRNLKRDFTAFSDEHEEISLSQASNPAASRYLKKRFTQTNPPKFSVATYQLDCARRIIEEAVENSKTSIDLSEKNLTTLPDDIADLKYIVSASQAGSFSTHLELFLSKNRLTTLPEALFEIENLAFLGLSGNRLTSLSPSIAKLKNLLSLNIGLNHIDFFPAALLKLDKLEHLIFHSSQIPVSPQKSQRSSQGRSPHLECPPKTIIVSRRSPTTLHSSVPSLVELCMRVVARDEYYSDITHDFLTTLPIPPHAVSGMANPHRCDECGTWMCDVYATREESWAGFARTEGLPIRRNLCGPNCLDSAPSYLAH